MREGPEGLPINFYSVVLKKTAVAVRFPGGLAGLHAQFEITRQNDALALLVSMSASDAAHIINELEGAGLRAGEDFALADMMQGPLLPCPGIAFKDAGDEMMPIWYVVAGLLWGDADIFRLI